MAWQATQVSRETCRYCHGWLDPQTLPLKVWSPLKDMERTAYQPSYSSGVCISRDGTAPADLPWVSFTEAEPALCSVPPSRVQVFLAPASLLGFTVYFPDDSRTDWGTVKPQRNSDLHFPNGYGNQMNIFLYIHWPILLLLRTVQFICLFID